MNKRIKKKKVETPWETIGDVLPSVLNSIVKQKNSRPKNIDYLWKNAIDPRFVNYTKPERVRGDALYIKVSSGAMFAELAMVDSDEILQKLKSRGDFPKVRRIVYRR